MDCDHERVTSERAYTERPEGSYPGGIVGICDDCGASLRLSGEEDEDGQPTWELDDYTADELVQIQKQSAA